LAYFYFCQTKIFISLNNNTLKIIAWINAFRLRTLPLAISSTIMGIISAKVFGYFNLQISIWTVVTITLLQILSNLANDYGDGIKGTDNEERLGPLRTVQSGIITPKEMKNAVIVFALLSFFSGLYLLFLSDIEFFEKIIFLLMGLAAIAAAIYYTVGNKAYGYKGFGDLFVFIFFGIVAVSGSFFLVSGNFQWKVLLPASTLGFLSTAVLNLNNMRDIKNDLKMSKKTIAVRLGIKNTKLYHTILINLAFLCLLAFVGINHLNWYVYLSFIIYPLFLVDLIKIDKETNLQKLDPFLKKTALKTFLLVIIFGVLVFV